jgi:hypothetical protein
MAEHMNMPHQRRNNNHETPNNGNKRIGKSNWGTSQMYLLKSVTLQYLCLCNHYRLQGGPKILLSLSDSALIDRTYNLKDYYTEHSRPSVACSASCQSSHKSTGSNDRVSILDEGREFSLHLLQIGSEDHSLSYSVAAGKRPEHEADHLPPPSTEGG